MLVSLQDARAFCTWLSEKEGREYQIPTEAQWEYACQAGSSDIWPFGNNQSELIQYAWYDDPHANPTRPVGKKRPNAFGLFDMLGNVAEWTNDWYAADYYANSPLVNPAGAATGTKSVLRGGCFKWSVDLARPASRCFAFEPHTGWHDVGFRIILKIPYVDGIVDQRFLETLDRNGQARGDRAPSQEAPAEATERSESATSEESAATHQEEAQTPVEDLTEEQSATKNL